ncbi:phage integrase SAM-like domain-containing protein [Porphyromonas crevioricanis]|uniref:phage integrase SAM-like domain-containing protein n=1 Tax=Porphyromonas crevioricanis TaxID=393921 RepID=UPI00130EBB6F
MFTRQVGEQNQWTPSTFQKFRTLRHRLKSFAPNISFPSLTEEKLQNLINYCNKKRLSKHNHIETAFILAVVLKMGGSKRVLQR